jgi:hypothetical protein
MLLFRTKIGANVALEQVKKLLFNRIRKTWFFKAKGKSFKGKGKSWKLEVGASTPLGHLEDRRQKLEIGASTPLGHMEDGRQKLGVGV